MDFIFYDGSHSIKFGDKDSWEDWHLIPTSKPVISPPSVKVKQVDIPGTNGVMDLSSVLTGYPTYGNRTGSLEFILAPGFDYWENAKALIMGYLHGKITKVYLKDDPDHYYIGMLSVNGLKSDAKTNGITINYDLQPFRYDLITSDEDWLWDPFNFEIGVIKEWGSLIVNGSLELQITDCTVPAMPEITSNTEIYLEHKYLLFDGVTERSREYVIPEGTSTPGFTLRPDLNILNFYTERQYYGKQIDDLGLNGNVDLKNRPIVDAEAMHNAGYTEFDGDYASLYSQTRTWVVTEEVESEEVETTFAIILLTPIKQNGTVLSEAQVDAYLSGLYENCQTIEELIAADSNGLIIHVLPDEQISEMDEIAEKAHELSAAWEETPDSVATIGIHYRGGCL